MLLTCPDCSTSYKVKDDAIGPNGRMVRCSKCSNAWYVAGDPDLLQLKDQEQDDVEAMHIPSPPAPKKTIENGPMDVSSAAAPIGAHVQFRDKVDQRRRNRRLIGVSMIWVTTLGLLAAGAVLAFLLRQPIVDRMPETASLYKAFGVNVKAAGLDFEKPKTKHMEVDGQAVLVVNGYIRNRSNEEKVLPLVELSLLNAGGDKVAQWMVELEQPRLPARDRIEYVSQYPNPPLDAVTLEYQFMNEDVPAP